MRKGKMIVTITIGIMCLILTMVIFLQVRTISQADVSELEIMRESELKTEISTLKTKYEEIVAQLKTTNNKVLEYEKAIEDGNEASKLQEKELEEMESLLGKKAVKGKGVIINLANTGQSAVTANDLLHLVNLLKNAGAEAISINEQRIVYSTHIVNINGTNYISVNGEYISAPYTVKAIGNTTYLESAIAQKKYGYIDTKISEGKDVTIERMAELTVPKYTGNLEFEYVRGEE